MAGGEHNTPCPVCCLASLARPQVQLGWMSTTPWTTWVHFLTSRPRVARMHSKCKARNGLLHVRGAMVAHGCISIVCCSVRATAPWSPAPFSPAQAQQPKLDGVGRDAAKPVNLAERARRARQATIQPALHRIWTAEAAWSKCTAAAQVTAWARVLGNTQIHMVPLPQAMKLHVGPP